MKLTRWLRVVHRDVGFLVVGVSLIYGISGLYLNHLTEKDPAFHTEERSVRLPARLTPEALETTWNTDPHLPPLKKIFPVDDTHFRLMLEGGIGVYRSTDGQVDYERHEKRVFIYWINRLHYNKVKGWSPVADFFAVALIFLAVSGIFLVKGKRGLAGSGKWYLLAGVLIPVLYAILSS